MNVKKFLGPVVVLVVGVALIFAFATPKIAGFVSLPDNVKSQVTMLILGLVAFAFSRLIILLPWLAWLEPYQEPLGYALADALIMLFQNAIPDQWGGVAILALQLLLALVAVLTALHVMKKRGVKFLSLI